MAGWTGRDDAAARHRRRRTARILAVAAGFLALLAVLVPIAVAEHGGLVSTVAEAVGGSEPAPAPAPTPATHSAHPASRASSRPAAAPPATATATAASAAAQQAAQATVTIASGADTVPVPSSYFGISTEYWALTPSLFWRNTPVFERVLSLLHVQGDGPLILRIGGDSADHSFWHPHGRQMPGWAFELTPSYLSRLGTLVERDRVKLIVDLNLVTDNALTAADWARAAEAALPHGSIDFFEVGNEPDLYSRRFWVATIRRSPLETTALPLELTPATYVQDFASYARVLGESAPDIPLMGPAVAHPRVGVQFITTLIQDERPELGAVSGHIYPYSACVKRPRSTSYPTVERILSRQATSAFATDIASAVAAAHAAGLKFRLTEFNSVTCGGKAGVSDTFATALWAPDALFTAMRAGADGANLHVRATAINAAFAISKGGLTPRPLLYGLMLFNRTLGPQARLVRVHVAAPRSLNLSAWGVRIRGGILHVLLIDKSSRPVRVRLHLPATGPATVQRLLAPSPYSRSGVTLNGQHLNYAAEWTGTPRTEPLPRATGGYTLTVTGRSAALLTVRLASTAPGRRVAASEHHRRVAVAHHPVLAVRLHGARKH